MASWKLRVEDYGKIESAEIEVAPLTLFVGDNNSGKSYLLSLLWGIEYFGIEGLIGDEFIEMEETNIFQDWLTKQVEIAIENKENIVSLEEIYEALATIWNIAIDRNKDRFVQRIFNSEKATIGKIAIQLEEYRNAKLCIKCNNYHGMIMFNIDKYSGREFGIPVKRFFEEKNNKKQNPVWFVLQSIYLSVININIFANNYGNDEGVYLPAARTGFMLTKSIINSVGRNITFNILQDREEITPFIRPINHFLDIMDSLSEEKKANVVTNGLVEFIEREMINGSLKISSMPNKEVQYVPEGLDKQIPLRLTSAVVTEIAPLLLILKHKEYFKRFYYEEPEMCLHPQLQHSMGKVITRIVNSGCGMIATTHSDIILQHINNMIKLPNNQDKDEICNKLGYSKEDFLSKEDVKVYQFGVMSNGKSVVNELSCGEDGFVVPTFNNALDKIMNEAYEIQG